MPSHSRPRDRDRTRGHPESRRERHYERHHDRDRQRDRARRSRNEDGDGYYTSDRDRDRDRTRRKRPTREYYDQYTEEESDSADELRRLRESPVERRGERSNAKPGPRERERSKAKESPVTSPRKRDDRSGHRRYRAYEDSGSPVRERHVHRHGDRDTGRNRERERRRERERESRSKHQSSESTNSASHLLSADALARLSEQHDAEDEQRASDQRRRRKKPLFDDYGPQPQSRPQLRDLPELEVPEPPRISQRRAVSGPYLEEGRAPDMEVRPRRGRGGRSASMEAAWRKDGWNGSLDGSERVPFWKRKRWWIILACILAVLAIVIPVAVVVSKKKHPYGDGGGHGSDSSGESSGNGSPSNSNLDSISRSSIPESAKGTVLDPFVWYDTTDFNVTYTNETVGGLSVMGLNSTWDDSTRANEHVPPLNEPFPYGSQPIRGVNLGGWLSIEPFITPSLFNQWSSRDGVIDEWTLSEKLGGNAGATIEKHYAKFINEQDFADIRNAGLDHVRIQYSYWAVKTYPGDPYVAKIAWRYLLRAIEYCRKYGLRVKLDLHGIQGSQNGWNHSGRQGPIKWIKSDKGEENLQRSVEIHNQLSKFFAQDRYKNVLTIYGLVNEPLMLSLPIKNVLQWTVNTTQMVQDNGITAWVALHDGFLNLAKWHNMLKTRPDKMMLDTHQYTIFNKGEIVLNHTAKVDLICSSWYDMISKVNSTSNGWGPTFCGEWSQADTDCAQFLNNVGRGARWTGTFNPKDDNSAYCPTADSPTQPACSCDHANASPSQYTNNYKTFLRTYAEAQMSAFETGMGWFYWTWKTESAAQWSYSTAWKNGFMPNKAYAPDFRCGDDVPDFGDLPNNY